MTHKHPVSYLVTVTRHGHLMHSQTAETRADADALAATFGRAPGTDVDITEVHDRAETDLTAHTREILEDLRIAEPPSAE